MQVDQHDFHGLVHGVDLLEAELRRQLAPLGIQPRQAQVIEALARIGPVRQADLAAEFGVTAASMSTMTDRLLAAGWLTRSVDPASRRQNIVALTPEGRKLLDGIAKAWSVVDETVRGILGSEADSFFQQARVLRDGLGGVVPGTRSDRETKAAS